MPTSNVLLTEISETLVASIQATYDSLDTLNLSNNRIASIENLASLKSLTSLNMAGNQISMLQNMHEVVGLLDLDLSSNKIHSLEGMAPCLHLKNLRLDENRIPSVSELLPLRGLASLHSLSLRGNPVSHDPDYRWAVRRLLPQLLYLDGDLLGPESQPEVVVPSGPGIVELPRKEWPGQGLVREVELSTEMSPEYKEGKLRSQLEAACREQVEATASIARIEAEVRTSSLAPFYGTH